MSEASDCLIQTQRSAEEWGRRRGRTEAERHRKTRRIENEAVITEIVDERGGGGKKNRRRTRGCCEEQKGNEKEERSKAKKKVIQANSCSQAASFRTLPHGTVEDKQEEMETLNHIT